MVIDPRSKWDEEIVTCLRETASDDYCFRGQHRGELGDAERQSIQCFVPNASRDRIPAEGSLNDISRTLRLHTGGLEVAPRDSPGGCHRLQTPSGPACAQLAVRVYDRVSQFTGEPFRRMRSPLDEEGGGDSCSHDDNDEVPKRMRRATLEFCLACRANIMREGGG